MEIYKINDSQVNDMPKYVLSNEICNSESQLFVIKNQNGKEERDKLLKRYCLISEIMLKNKLKTINSLLNLEYDTNIENLVLPEKLAVINGEFSGFIMPFIDSNNLKKILSDFNTPIEFKIDYLKQIGGILRKLKKYRTYSSHPNFFLNDIQECNFIVENRSGKVFVVDVDSSKIDNNFVFASYYLGCYSPVYSVVKYKTTTNNICGGMIEPDENTELLCYNVMILNLLFNGNVLKLEMSNFYNYLDYLNELGLNKELIDIFAKIYDDVPNENPDYLLDCLKDVYPKSLFPISKRIKHT